MTPSADPPEALALGAALAALRRARGLSQAEAGSRLGVTGQAWGLYEAGRRPGLFRPDVQRRVTAALGLTPEDLALELVRSGGHNAAPSRVREQRMEEGGRAFSPSPASAANRRTLQLSHDELAPWAGSGVTLVYDQGVWPRPDQGCVVQTGDGPVVGLYDRGDAEAVHLKTPAGDRTRIARADIRALGAVIARLDGAAWPE